MVKGIPSTLLENSGTSQCNTEVNGFHLLGAYKVSRDLLTCNFVI